VSRRLGFVVVACLVFAACSSGSPGASSSPRGLYSPNPSQPISADWIEYHRDASRAGVGPSAPSLSNPVVAWKLGVDGDVYASPLIVAGHVIVATENNTVYSLDIFTGSVIWKTHLGDPVDASSLPCGDIEPISGITGTPAVDPSTGRVYVVAFMRGHHHMLFALSLVDGAVVFQQDVDPTGSTPSAQQQRGALSIGSGRVYIPLGGLYGDCGAYHGYVIAVPLSGGTSLFYRVPSSREAGIWTAMGATLDSAGNVYVVTGNGESRSAFDYSDSVIELSPDLQTVRSYFAPSNWIALSAGDVDLGALGATLLPSAGLVLAVGKDGVAYLLAAGQLGGIGGQLAKLSVCGGAFGGTAWSDVTVYVPCVDGLYALSLANRSIGVAWHKAQPALASPIISAGVVWAIEPSSGVLYAMDPSTGATLYSTGLGLAAHFSTPAATDGFVVVPAGNIVAAVSVVG
jgi:outer membrane protein assembly factor BamB